MYIYIKKMYNAKVKEAIDRYRNKVKNTEHFITMNRTWSNNAYKRNKEEDNEKYRNKLKKAKLNYYKKLYIKDSENFDEILSKLEKKDIELFNLVKEIL